MDVKTVHDLSTPVILALVGGFIRVMMLGTGKSKLMLLRGFIISIVLGCVAGVLVAKTTLDPALQGSTIALVAMIGGDFFEGLIRLAQEWKKDPKSIIKLFTGK